MTKIKVFTLSLVSALILNSCTDPANIGLEVQPPSDSIIISSLLSGNFELKTVSEDSLRTDNSVSLILGQIDDQIFGTNIGGFVTQLLLTENNIDLGSNPIVDSVILSYSYSGFYGDLASFTNIEVQQINYDIYRDSVYYSNSYELNPGSMNNVDNFIISENSENPFLKINLTNDFGQSILNLGNDVLKDNSSFLEQFKGISVSSFGSNCMLYLNQSGSNSFLKVYYHNDNSNSDTLSLDFELSGDAASFSLFNNKNSLLIIDDTSQIYIQSMAGYRADISIDNIDSLKKVLDNKVINKVSLEFSLSENSQYEFNAHDKLVLVRVDENGNNVFLSDFVLEGDQYFGGYLDQDKYEFNITRYFYQLLTNSSFSSKLRLLPVGAAVNANRTIIDNEVKLKINYSEL